VASAVENFGGLDIVLNNAGAIGEMGPTTEISTAGWLDTIASNLTSTAMPVDGGVSINRT